MNISIKANYQKILPSTMTKEELELELNSVKIHLIRKKKFNGRIPRPTFQEEEGLLWYLCAFPWY